MFFAPIESVVNGSGICFFEKKINTRRNNQCYCYPGDSIGLRLCQFPFFLSHDEEKFCQFQKSLYFCSRFRQKRLQKSMSEASELLLCFRRKRSVSSVGSERFLHTEEVESSNLPQTTDLPRRRGFFCSLIQSFICK